MGLGGLLGLELLEGVECLVESESGWASEGERERERESVNGGNVKIRVYKLSAMRHKIITGKIHSIIN